MLGLRSRWELPWPVNYAAPVPEGGAAAGAIAVVGDAPEALLLDGATGRVTATLRGHLDYSFAVAWHPNGITLATGNQVRDGLVGNLIV